MKLHQKILLTIGLAMAASLLASCRKAGVDFGIYNIGICPDGAGPFLASNVDVEKASFSIVATADGPDSVKKYDKPLVFKFVGLVGGLRKYVVQINGHEDEVLVRVDKGQFTGSFSVNNQLQATLQGHKGQLANLGQDGLVESKGCLGQ